jgi:DNA-binding response OmpR family regulator
VQHIAILSEDRVFSSLLARNLQSHGHQVEIHLLNARSPLSFLESWSAGDTSVWILDMGWYDTPRHSVYATLSEWCRGVPQPTVLLLDASWNVDQARMFNATSTLNKPFPVTNLVSVVNRLSTESCA